MLIPHCCAVVSFALVVLSSHIANGGIILHHVPAGQYFITPTLGIGPADPAPSNSIGGGNLQSIMTAAADWWSTRLNLSSRDIDIYYGWDSLPDNYLGLTTTYDDQPTVAIVQFDTSNNPAFFLDPTPYWNNEFQGNSNSSVTLTRGTYSGESLINGFNMPATQTSLAGSVDLFSIALHEIGHALGPDFNSTITSSVGTRIRDSDRHDLNGISLPEATRGHLNILGSLMYPNASSGKRTLISDADAAAVADGGEWDTSEPYIRRIGSHSGTFQDRSRWEDYFADTHVVPDSFSVVEFLNSDYTLDFDANEESKVCIITSGTTAFNLDGNDYRIRGYSNALPLAKALSIGPQITGVPHSANAVLRINGGKLTTPNVWIDGNPTSTTAFPTLIVSADAHLSVLNSSFYVGATLQGALIQHGTVDAYEITVGDLQGSQGRYTMNGDNLVISSSLYIGDAGSGLFEQNSGTVTAVSQIALGLKQSSASSRGYGEYILNGGLVEAFRLEVGRAGTGTFKQNGGQVRIMGESGADLRIGEAVGGIGIYRLDGGHLEVENMVYVGRIGQGTLSMSQIVAPTSINSLGMSLGNSSFSSGTLVQTAGNIWLRENLWVGRSGKGEYYFGDGELSVGDDLYCGQTSNSDGLFSQSGGKVYVDGNITLAEHPTAKGTYKLIGGELDINGGAISLGAGTSSFEFTGGTLHVGTFNGNLHNEGGILAPGAGIGTTVINGNYEQDSNGVLEIGLSDVFGDFRFDYVGVTGIAMIDGVLQLATLESFIEPDSISAFAIFQSSSLQGTFSNIQSGQRLRTVDGLGSFIVSYGPSSVFDPNAIYISAFQHEIMLNGDFDNDGDVDGRDFLAWQRGESPTPYSPGDLANWQNAYNGGAIEAVTAVPEPTSMLLIGFLSLSFLTCRSSNEFAYELLAPPLDPTVK